MYIRCGQTVAHSLCMAHGKSISQSLLTNGLNITKKNLLLGEHVASPHLFVTPRLLNMIIICS
jgi:hypothetical protein